MNEEYGLGGIEFDYSIETLKKYKQTSTEWKLNWLEESNELTFLVLSPKEKSIREKIRKGLL